jgi:small GTP-binding protein
MAESLQKMKIAICGPTAVGKSALTIVYLSNNFPKEYDPTIEDSFTATKEINGNRYLLEIVDTAGAEEYVVMQAEWIRQSEGFIIVYSIIDKNSFHDVDSFHDNILTYKNEDNSTDQVPMVLAANKCDLEENREVETAEGTQKAEKWGCALLECSAKSNLRVQDVFAKCVEAIVEVKKKDSKNSGTKRRACVIL